MTNLEYIKNLNVVNVIETDNDVVSYFDMELEEASSSPGGYATLNMKLKTADISLSEITEPTPKDKDIDFIVRTSLLKSIIRNLHGLSLKHKQEAEEKHIKSLDIDISDTSDSSVNKLIARILMCSNLIYNANRRGPANFIIASLDILNFINTQLSSEYVYVPEYNLSNTIRFIACEELGNTVIVGRNNDPKNQPIAGLHFLSKEGLLPDSNKLTEEKLLQDDVTSVDMKYALVDLGKTAHHNYIQFDVIFTEK